MELLCHSASESSAIGVAPGNVTVLLCHYCTLMNARTCDATRDRQCLALNYTIFSLIATASFVSRELRQSLITFLRNCAGIISTWLQVSTSNMLLKTYTTMQYNAIQWTINAAKFKGTLALRRSKNRDSTISDSCRKSKASTLWHGTIGDRIYSV